MKYLILLLGFFFLSLSPSHATVAVVANTNTHQQQTTHNGYFQRLKKNFLKLKEFGETKWYREGKFKWGFIVLIGGLVGRLLFGGEIFYAAVLIGLALIIWSFFD